MNHAALVLALLAIDPHVDIVADGEAPLLEGAVRP